MTSIRDERPEDAAAVRVVNESAFDSPAEADIVDLLRSRGKAVVSLVAAEEEKIVGHIMFSLVSIESEAGSFTAVGLAPMAVAPDRQRRGIGSLLVEKGLEECRKKGFECAVVLGHPDYYPRFGFVPASRYGISCEYDAPDEAFMAMELREGALANRSGVAKYQPEFNAV
jgi:putative acetyltransferase